MSTRENFLHRFPVLDVLHGAELLALLRSSSPSSESGPHLAFADDLARTYEIRSQHLEQSHTPHDHLLLADVQRLCSALATHRGKRVHLWAFTFESGIVFAVFAFDTGQPAAVCVRAASRLETDPSEWARLWASPE
jgi:hypothetical protein